MILHSCLAVFLLAGSATSAVATIAFQVTFDDPGNAYSAYYSQLAGNIQAAGAEWSDVIAGNGSLEVKVSFDTSLAGASGGSATFGSRETVGARTVYEQGATAEIRTGVDPNDVAPDIILIVGVPFLTGSLWLDPTPFDRTDEVMPSNKADGVSVFMHEFGHAFAFNGWRDDSTQQLPADYMSTFDQDTILSGGYVYFNGPTAVSLYGGPLALTLGNHYHFANNSPGPGSDLANDLMNGLAFHTNQRYELSPFDLAVAYDVGVPMIPEPGSATLLLGVTGLLAILPRRGARRTPC